MKLILLSEHYDPVLGGTTTYVKNVVSGLLRYYPKLEITLVVPGEKDAIEKSEFTLHRIGIGVNIATNYTRSSRYDFCKKADNLIKERIAKKEVEIVHILFGLFLTESLDVPYYRKHGLKVFNTIHNVPPQECSVSWKGDALFRYWKDRFRKRLVQRINHRRLQKFEYDQMIVPSKAVARLLGNVIPSGKIRVVEHGGDPKGKWGPKETLGQPLQLLTVGGLVPHKRQLLIPEVARNLTEAGLSFVWYIVGPNRNEGYVNAIEEAIARQGVEASVKLEIRVPFERLDELYRACDVFVQLSTEEGFCYTVLDAIYYGKPVIGTPAGAIPEMIEKGRGILTESHVESLSFAIQHLVRLWPEHQMDESVLERFVQHYSWERSIRELYQVYVDG